MLVTHNCQGKVESCLGGFFIFVFCLDLPYSFSQEAYNFVQN